MSIKTKFILVLLVPLIITLCFWISIFYFKVDFYNAEKVVSFYQQFLREPLFSGFLTIGAFLFSLKTFIVTIMKTEVYDSDGYHKKFEELHNIDNKIKKYDNLKNLSDLLYYIVLMSLITAVFQFTVGFIFFDLASLSCISLSISSIFLLIFGLKEMKANLDYLFNFE